MNDLNEAGWNHHFRQRPDSESRASFAGLVTAAPGSLETGVRAARPRLRAALAARAPARFRQA